MFKVLNSLKGILYDFGDNFKDFIRSFVDILIKLVKVVMSIATVQYSCSNCLTFPPYCRQPHAKWPCAQFHTFPRPQLFYFRRHLSTVEWHLIVGDAENVKCKLTHNPDGNTYSVTSSFARTTRKGVENNPADFHTLLATSLPLFQAPLVSERSRKNRSSL